MKNNMYLIFMIIILLFMSACSDFRRAIGTEKSSPNEFEVITRPPLSLPPDFMERPNKENLDQTIGEKTSSILNEIKWKKLLNQPQYNAIPVSRLGKVISENKFLISYMGNTIVNMSLSDLSDAYENSIPSRISND